MTSPEQIVRALAAADPILHDMPGGRYLCTLCGYDDQDPPGQGHLPDCPWRLAVEWVAAQDAEPIVTYDDAVGRIAFTLPTGLPGSEAAAKIDAWVKAAIRAGLTPEDAARLASQPAADPSVKAEIAAAVSRADCHGPCEITDLGRGEPEYACTLYGLQRCEMCPGRGQ